MYLVTGTLDRASLKALSMLTKSGEDEKKLPAPEFDTKGNSCLPMILNDGCESFDNSPGLPFPITDVLLNFWLRRYLGAHLEERTNSVGTAVTFHELARAG